ALRFKVLLEHIERRSLAARGPPMEDFDLIGMGDQRKTGCKNSRQQQFAQHSFPPLGCDRTEWLLATPLTSRLVKSDPRHKCMSIVPFRRPAGRRYKPSVLPRKRSDRTHILFGELEIESLQIAQAVFALSGHR